MENQYTRKNHPASAYYLFLSIIIVAFLGFTVVFLFFPRPKYSELEKRDLTEFPDLSTYKGRISELPSDISAWFSDSQPFRDGFMTMSMSIRDAIGLRVGNPDEQISFRPADQAELALADAASADELLEAAGNPLANANAKTANSGIVVVGKEPNVRALMAFGGTPQHAVGFINMTKDYAKALPGVKLYALLPPAATEFYLPDKAASLSKSAKPVLDYIKANLPENAQLADAYSYLAAHTNEDIYLRTDHHWAPLGAFYGAKAFAKVAGVPFKELDSYDKHVIHGFVGSMYGYSKDISVKNSPEDFVYYTPKGLNLKTTYVTYKTNKDYKVVSASAPYEGNFFHKFNDGSGNAYLTFMGGDQHLVKVETGTPSKRKLLIIKDSYGNPVPSFLFYSFAEIHVVDFRYFPQNLKDYAQKNGITDILFALNIFNAVTPGNMQRVSNLLRGNGQMAAPDNGNSSSNNAKNPEKPAPKKEGAKEKAPAAAPAPEEEKPAATPAPETKPEQPAAPAPQPAPASSSD